MDNDGLDMRNWGYYDRPYIGHLGPRLMPSMVDRDTRTFLPGRDNPSMMATNGLFHSRDSVVSQASSLTQIDLVRDNWINHREKFLHMFPGGNPYSDFMPDTSESSVQMIQTDPVKEEEVVALEDPSADHDSCRSKKRPVPAASAVKPKKPKKGPKKNDDNAPAQRAKPAKKSIDVVISGIDMDISSIPTPVCSCTGTPQQCYRWGCGGWQSACCTTTISMYPLPMNNKRRGARIAGRKMSQGAFKKVLEKLASESYNFADPIDLRTYWAKHGTNKFVTIR